MTVIMMRKTIYAICLLALFACTSRPEHVQQVDASHLNFDFFVYFFTLDYILHIFFVD